MIAENFKLLIEKLKRKTLKKEAIWTKTSRDEEFKLDIGNISILTDNWFHEIVNQQAVDINIFNRDGEKIEGILLTENELDFKTLLELHNLAKQSYYRIDETFKSIFDELDSNRIVGEKKKNELDDLI
jgi:hypothetical protein